MSIDTKFNIYYATTANGPWTLANSTPIDRVANGNQYTVTGLEYNTLYYVAIVGGYESGTEFIPLASQIIGPKTSGAGGVEVQSTPPLAIRTFTPQIQEDSYISHEFTVTL